MRYCSFMRIFPIILVVALVVSACEVIPPGEIDSRSSSSSDEDSSVRPLEFEESAYRGVDEEDAALAVWHAIEAWTPTVPWLSPKEGKNSENIIIDDSLRAIPPDAIKVASIESNIDHEVFENAFMGMDSRDSLDAVLGQEGWVRHSFIDADGSTGTVWGYRRNSDEGMRFLMVSAFCADASKSPSVPCAQWRAVVTVTAAIAPGRDL
jgi:hypothetical protein